VAGHTVVKAIETVHADRQRLLERVAGNLRRADLPGAERDHPPAFAEYSFDAAATPAQLVDLFARELEPLAGHVHQVTEAAAPAVVLDLVLRYGARRVLAWQPASAAQAAVASELQRHGIEVLGLDLGRDAAARRAELSAIEDIAVGLTGAHAALADTGSLVLTSGPGRMRLASLLPPVHIALVRQADLYPALPAFLAANPDIVAAGSNVVIVTGPSRTADIEMTLSHGVHGPKHLHVVVTT
jgi:L-lactate dehydrogenase complex protein LldG